MVCVNFSIIMKMAKKTIYEIIIAKIMLHDVRLYSQSLLKSSYNIRHRYVSFKDVYLWGNPVFHIFLRPVIDCLFVCLQIYLLWTKRIMCNEFRELNLNHFVGLIFRICLNFSCEYHIVKMQRQLQMFTLIRSIGIGSKY